MNGLNKLSWLAIILLVLISASHQSNDFDYDALHKEMDQQVDQTTQKVGRNFTDSYHLWKNKDKRLKHLSKREIFTDGPLSNSKKQQQPKKSFITKYIQSSLGTRIKKASSKVIKDGLQKEVQNLQKRMNLFKRGQISVDRLQVAARESATRTAKKLTTDAGKVAHREADRWKAQMLGQAPK
jgi:hypothetical protein